MWWFAALHANPALLCGRMGGRAAARKAARRRLRHRRAACASGRPRCRIATRSGSTPTASRASAPGSRADARSVPARSMRCPSPTARLARSSAPTCCATAGSTSAWRWRSSTAVLCENGILILNLPAYSWLSRRTTERSPMSGGIRREGSRGCSKAPGSGCCSRAIGTQSCSRLMVLTRKLLPRARRRDQRRHASSASGRGPVPRRDRARTGLLRRGIRLPFGGSVIAVAAKQASQQTEQGEHMPDSMPLLPADADAAHPAQPRSAQFRRRCPSSSRSITAPTASASWSPRSKSCGSRVVTKSCW